MTNVYTVLFTMPNTSTGIPCSVQPYHAGGGGHYGGSGDKGFLVVAVASSYEEATEVCKRWGPLARCFNDSHNVNAVFGVFGSRLRTDDPSVPADVGLLLAKARWANARREVMPYSGNTEWAAARDALVKLVGSDGLYA